MADCPRQWTSRAQSSRSAADYDIVGRSGGKPSAVLALFQLPDSNAIQAAKNVKKTMEELKKRFPSDIDYHVPDADTNPAAVTEGIQEIGKTFGRRWRLLVVVVFIFLQGLQCGANPAAAAVPVSLIGTFALFPAVGIFHQYLVSFWPGFGHRSGRGRCHRRG